MHDKTDVDPDALERRTQRARAAGTADALAFVRHCEASDAADALFLAGIPP